MIAALAVSMVLAALQASPSSPAPSSPTPAPRSPSSALSVPAPSALNPIVPTQPMPTPAATPLRDVVHDIAPPVDVFPYPRWMVITAIAVAAVLFILLTWFVVAWIRRRPGPPPLSPEDIALRELAKLKAKAPEAEPYQFSVAVSDVLRTFIGDAKFRLPATRLTSPEFLAAISNSVMFTEDDRTLLGHFLEKCDLIKFARMDATSSDNTELVESALAFVKGGSS
jgi:hypothetical protein